MAYSYGPNCPFSIWFALRWNYGNEMCKTAVNKQIISEESWLDKQQNLYTKVTQYKQDF